MSTYIIIKAGVTMRISTHRKNNIDIENLDPLKSAVIIINDSTEQKIFDSFEERNGPVRYPVDTLHLFFDDIKNEELNHIDTFLSNMAHTKQHTAWLKDFLSNGWPTLPMTPWHAQKIVNFAYSVGFEKDIYISCHYGRSRSVTIATFLKQYMFPSFDIEFSRKSIRTNNRMIKLLNNAYQNRKIV